MSLRSFDLEISSATNPIDVFEDVVSADYDHEVSRVADYELVLNCRGLWTSYEMHCYWQPAQQALHTSCLLEMRVAPASLPSIFQLLSDINARLWFGHFEIDREGDLLSFRHTTLLRGVGTVSSGQIQDILDISIGECDRFFPAFQMVLWGGLTPEKAMQSALLETVGEA